MSGVDVAQLVLQLKRTVVRIPPLAKFSFFVQYNSMQGFLYFQAYFYVNFASYNHHLGIVQYEHFLRNYLFCINI